MHALIGFAASLGPSGAQEFQAALNALASLVHYLRYLHAHGHFFSRCAPFSAAGLAGAAGTAGVEGTPGEFLPEVSSFGVFATDGVLFICRTILPLGGSAGARCLPLAAECSRYLEEAEFAAQMRPEDFSVSIIEVVREIGRNLRLPTEPEGDGEERCDISDLTGFLARLGPRALAAQDVGASLACALCSQETIEDSAAITYCLLRALLAEAPAVSAAPGGHGPPGTCGAADVGNPAAVLPAASGPVTGVLYSIIHLQDPFHNSLAAVSLPELPPFEALAALSGGILQFLGDLAIFYVVYLSEYRGQAFSSILALLRPALLLFSRASIEQGLDQSGWAGGHGRPGEHRGHTPRPISLPEPLEAGGPVPPPEAPCGSDAPADRGSPACPLFSWARECVLAVQPICKGENDEMVGRALQWLSWACCNFSAPASAGECA